MPLVYSSASGKGLQTKKYKDAANRLKLLGAKHDSVYDTDTIAVPEQHQYTLSIESRLTVLYTTRALRVTDGRRGKPLGSSVGGVPGQQDALLQHAINRGHHVGGAVGPCHRAAV